MKIAFTCVLLLLGFVPTFADERPPGERTVLERKLIGQWDGGACMGDYTFYPDGTFDIIHYSPGGNILTGTWILHGDAVPATLALTYKTSDFKKVYKDRSEFEFLGKTRELKVTQLNDESFSYRYPGEQTSIEYTRAEKPEVLELEALQGTWTPLQHDKRGQGIDPTRQHIIKGDKITVLIKGEVKAEGKVTLDATRNPKQMTFEFASGETESMIYVRTENYVITCGNRDKTRPTEFMRSTAKGGDYLAAWTIKH